MSVRYPKPRAVEILRSDVVKISQWSLAKDPHEACGLLVGRVEEAITRVVRVTQAENRARRQAERRYVLAPEDFLGTLRRARADGLEILGVWHSHPQGVAEPSETDRAEAWPGYSYLIAATDRTKLAELRSWRLVGERFREEELRVCELGTVG